MAASGGHSHLMVSFVLRFTMRTALVAMLCASLIVAYVADAFRIDRLQQQLSRDIFAHGGRLVFRSSSGFLVSRWREFELDVSGDISTHALKYCIRRASMLSRVTHIAADSRWFSRDIASTTEALRQSVRDLTIHGGVITSAEAHSLPHCALERIEVADVAIDESIRNPLVISHLLKSAELKDLPHFPSCIFDDNAKMSLESLGLARLSLDGRHWSLIAGFDRLQSLLIRECNIDDQSLCQIGRLTCLVDLDIDVDHVLGFGLRNLAGMTRLRSLVLSKRPTAYDVESDLVESQNDLFPSVLSDKGTVKDSTNLELDAFPNLPSLETLSLVGITSNKDGWVRISSQMNLRSLNCLDCNLDDESVESIGRGNSVLCIRKSISQVQYP